MTYAMRMTPPETYMNDSDAAKRGSTHFKWYILNEDELPDICTCPSANRDHAVRREQAKSGPGQRRDVHLPVRCVLPDQRHVPLRHDGRIQAHGQQGVGGINPPVPDPSAGNNVAVARPVDNAQQGSPTAYVNTKLPPPDDASKATTTEVGCYIQATESSQIDNPGRVYFMADSREYRPTPKWLPPRCHQ